MAGQFLATTPLQGVVFGLLSIPVCLWAAYTDLSRMKIRNGAALALLAIFVLAGPFVMPWSEYFWRYLHFAVILLAGFALATLRAVGAGDAKFAAAMAPFVALPDARAVLIVFAGLLIATFLAHRTLRHLPAIRRITPGWRSWDEARDFPMGITLAATQVTYLGLAAWP